MVVDESVVLTELRHAGLVEANMFYYMDIPSYMVQIYGHAGLGGLDRVVSRQHEREAGPRLLVDLSRTPSCSSFWSGWHIHQLHLFSTNCASEEIAKASPCNRHIQTPRDLLLLDLDIMGVSN